MQETEEVNIAKKTLANEIDLVSETADKYDKYESDCLQKTNVKKREKKDVVVKNHQTCDNSKLATFRKIDNDRISNNENNKENVQDDFEFVDREQPHKKVDTTYQNFSMV